MITAFFAYVTVSLFVVVVATVASTVLGTRAFA